MLLRPAVAGDEPAVAEVHVRSWQAAYKGLIPGEYLNSLNASDWAPRYTFADSGPGRPRTILAVDGDAVGGFATIGPCRDEGLNSVGELYALYADPSRWNSGVGRVLMHDARRRLADQGFREAVLWVLAGNDRAERFYRIDGWRTDGEDRLWEIRGVKVREIRYTRGLA